MPESTDFPSELSMTLRDVIQQYEVEVQPWRDIKLREWRKAQLYWDGENDLWWSAVAHDYRYPGVASIAEREEFDLENEDNRNINIYESHGRSIIAALSSTIPGVRFFPKDAKNAKDLLTAKTYSKIADILSKENVFPLLFAKALYLMFNQDYVAAHIFNEAKFEHGSYFEEVLNPQGNLEAYIEQPKSKTKIDVYGAMHVTISPFIRHQKDTPYLMLKSVQSKAKVMEVFGKDKDTMDRIEASSRRDDSSEDSYLFKDELEDENYGILREVWLRPWALFMGYKTHSEEVMRIRQKYPEGIKVTFFNDELLEVEESDLDKHWVITSDPLSDFLIGKAIGKNLIPIQEMTTDLNDLTMQTIEHGIPTEFADPEVIDFDKIEDHSGNPGVMVPAKPVMGRGLRESFHTTEKATLSKEVSEYNQYLNYSGQFVSGDFPSVHGGSLTGGSRTASEYSQSKQTALQKLSISYKGFSYWIAEIYRLGVMDYKTNLREDENFVDYKEGAYFNIWIRLQDLTGNVGRAEPVGSDVFPNTPAFVRELLFSLIEMKNPMINTILSDTDNLPFVSKALGLNDISVPGEADRAKQWAEIAILKEDQPLDLQGIQVPSVQIEQDVDDHAIQFDVCIKFLKSGDGQILKEINPTGYLNVLLHALQHKQILDIQFMQQQEQAMMEGAPDGG